MPVLSIRILHHSRKADTPKGYLLFGDPPGIRTPDPLLKRHIIGEIRTFLVFLYSFIYLFCGNSEFLYSCILECIFSVCNKSATKSECNSADNRSSDQGCTKWLVPAAPARTLEPQAARPGRSPQAKTQTPRSWAHLPREPGAKHAKNILSLICYLLEVFRDHVVV